VSKFIAMIENKAFVMALLSSAAAAAAIFGYNLPVASILSVYAPLMAMLGVQGWTTAAQTRLATQHAHELRMETLAHAGANAERAKQAGFSRLGMMLGVAVIAAALLMVVQLARNSSSEVSAIDATEGVVLGPAGCATAAAIGSDGIDCLKTEADAVASGVSVAGVFSSILTVIGEAASGNWGAIVTSILNLGKANGPNLVACICNNWPTPGGGSGSAGSGATVLAGATLYGGFTMPAGVKAQLLQGLVGNKKLIHPTKK